jgi:TonB family protein
MQFDGAPESSEQRDARLFRRNLSIVGGAHLFVLCILFAIGKWQPRVAATQVLWLDGGGLSGSAEPSSEASPASPAHPPRANRDAENEPGPVPDAQTDEEEPPDVVAPPPPPRPAPQPAPSEIVVPKNTPHPTTPTPKPDTPKPATPRPATPKPTPATPKPTTPKRTTPRPKPATSPKTTPKKSAPSPKPSPSKSTDDDSATPKPKASPTSHKATPAPSKENDAKAGDSRATPVADKKSGSAMAGSGAGSGSSGASGSGSGNGKAAGHGTGTGTNEFSWYYEMLDDRFTNRWQQPLSIVRSTQDFVTTLKIRINKDGTIASREIANSSGNPVMDESVLEAARTVVAVDPLPAGLGGDSFEVNINFKLDQGQ